MMIHVVKSDMQESKKKRKRKSNFMGYVKLQIFKQDKAVSHKGHLHVTSDGNADRICELSRALTSFEEM